MNWSILEFMSQERLHANKIQFIPKVEKIEKLDGFFGHKEIEANGFEVRDAHGRVLKLGYENVCVMLNSEKITLLPK